MFPIKLPDVGSYNILHPHFETHPNLTQTSLAMSGNCILMHFIIPVVHYSNTWNSKPPLFVADWIPPQRPHEDHRFKGNSTWNIQKPHGFYHEKYGCFPWFFPNQSNEKISKAHSHYQANAFSTSQWLLWSPPGTIAIFAHGWGSHGWEGHWFLDDMIL